VEVQQPGISLRHGKEGGGRIGSARISSTVCGQLQSGGGILDPGDNMSPEVRSLRRLKFTSLRSSRIGHRM
jgi:hypothetical protein